MTLTFDDTAVIDIPNSDAWGALYEKFRAALVDKLNHCYSLEDREDAVEHAFEKMMHKTGGNSGGERMLRTESGWFFSLRWQARSYLSHLKERGDVHARYVDFALGECGDGFVSAGQGDFLDNESRRSALERGFAEFRREQGVSRRNLEIFLALVDGEPADSLAEKHNMTKDNIYVVKHRVGRLLNKYANRYFRPAVDGEPYGKVA